MSSFELAGSDEPGLFLDGDVSDVTFRGDVMLYVLVDPDGRRSRVAVMPSSIFQAFDDGTNITHCDGLTITNTQGEAVVNTPTGREITLRADDSIVINKPSTGALLTLGADGFGTYVDDHDVASVVVDNSGHPLILDHYPLSAIPDYPPHP